MGIIKNDHLKWLCRREGIDSPTMREERLSAELLVMRQEKEAAEAVALQLKQTEYRRYQDMITGKERDNQALIGYLRSTELATAPGIERALVQ